MHFRGEDSKQLTARNFNRPSESDRFSKPIDLTKEIKYFKILVEVDDLHRTSIIGLLEAVNTGHANLVHSILKSSILMS